MTETELTDKLREAIVLDGPDVWRSNGYLQEAQAAGLSLAAALKLANEVSQEISNNSILFENIQTRIARLALPSRSHLIEQDLNQIVNAAVSLKLSADFVRNRWVPAVMARLAKSSAPQPPEPPVTTIPVTTTTHSGASDAFTELIEREPARPEPESRPAEPELVVAEPPKPVSPPVPEPVAPVNKPTEPPAEPSKPAAPPEPAPVVRKFTATPAKVRKGQGVTLEWNVDNLLAVTIDDLGEGLSPQNRGWVKPTKTTDYTLFDANNNPLSTVRVEVIPPDRSGVYGVLFALALLALIYWLIRNNSGERISPEPQRRTERTTYSTGSASRTGRQAPVDDQETEAASTQTLPGDESSTTVVEETKPVEEPAQPPVADNPPASEPETVPTTPADARAGKYEEAFGGKPYDKIELGTDERGWRRARSNGRWGFIDENDEWVIQPEFEAVTPFRGNTAGAFLNGQLITINRNGERIK
ncbi:WG repeat-containing protein [Spirosoma taeanense]|uniref:WG repeat-containing protein n=1 Tax=Spirosoma taeanense TaxID=2735870 RepID=A0A6M5YBV5_9BACT|nr:WG repeat-containing protein [Spirosoma taeanense]QJW90796.1 WG repeat-containing protein [Spirosoma taeanense]